MEWEIAVAVILAIGICTAVIEALQKRTARKGGSKNTEVEQCIAKETSRKGSEQI